MSNIKNGSSLDQPHSLNGFIENSSNSDAISQSKIYSRLLEQDESSKQILKAVAENDRIQSRALQGKVNLSRAPVLLRTKKLSEINLLLRGIVPGTENHSKPTYLYCLAPGVTAVAISCAIAKLSTSEYLSIEGNSIEPPKSSSSKVTFSTFDMVQEVLELAFQKIADLENRLSQVEDLLHHSSAIDREKLLSILKSQKG